MTLVNTETGELVETLSTEDARRLTDRIRLLAESLADTLEKLAALIDDARAGSAWLALGYRSWTEYVSTEFAGVLPRLDREPRQEFVRELAARGMSTRAIAPIVGASQPTVSRDLAGDSHESPRDPKAEAQARIDERADASRERQHRSLDRLIEETATEATPTVVTGIDGKAYSQPAPKPRPLKPVADEFTDQDRAEELARNLARNLSLLYALTNPERRAEYIATWRDGTADLKPLGWDFITPTHMRDLSAALLDFATEWEQNNG